MQAIVLSFESLAARSIGCYGNEWIETPNFDKLASAGVVFDLHFADVVDDRAGSAWFTATTVSGTPEQKQLESLSSHLKQVGAKSKFISAVQNASWMNDVSFDHFDSVEGQIGPYAQPSEVPIAHLVKAAVAAWKDPSFQSDKRILWLHAPEPSAPPEGFDSLYFEDFEERGQAVDELSAEERRGHPATYAGSVSLIDHWLGELISGLDLDNEQSPTLLIVAAAKGNIWQPMPGAQDTSDTRYLLTDQTIQTPLILRFWNDNRFTILQGQREHRLTQTQDVMLTLVDWFGGLDPDDANRRSLLRQLLQPVPSRERIRICHGDKDFAIRAREWLAIQGQPTVTGSPSANLTPPGHLYVKPEDVWDRNDVAAQNPEIVSKLLRPTDS